MLYSADDHYDDEITSGRSWEMDIDCDDCYPFECSCDDPRQGWLDYEALAPRPIQPDTFTGMNGR